jgi:hypothetical protein
LKESLNIKKQACVNGYIQSHWVGFDEKAKQKINYLVMVTLTII